MYMPGRPIPEDYFIGNVTKEEAETLDPTLRRTLTLEFASGREIHKYNKKIAREIFQKHDRDCG